jgi:hypothetical protein
MRYATGTLTKPFSEMKYPETGRLQQTMERCFRAFRYDVE